MLPIVTATLSAPLSAQEADAVANCMQVCVRVYV
jgi:hypothetical protein